MSGFLVCLKIKMLYSDIFIVKALRGDFTFNRDIKIKKGEKLIVLSIKVVMFFVFVVIWILAKIPIVSSVVETIARVYSRNSIGYFLRGAYYKAKLKKMGKDVIIDQDVSISFPEVVEIGDNCHLDRNLKIEGGGNGGFVKIGNYVHIGSNVVIMGRSGVVIGDYSAITSGSLIYSGTALFKIDNSDRLVSLSHMAPFKAYYIGKKPVKIGKYVFIGPNSTILPEVNIGDNAVIKVGSVVSVDVPKKAIVQGVVSKIIKSE